MKQINYLFILFITSLIILIGCNNKNQKVDEVSKNEDFERISEKELIPIVKDVLLIESAIYFKANQGADVKTLTNFYYDKIFKKYNITRIQFYSSLKYHLQNDIYASSIFLGAINILTVETDSVRKNETSLKVPDLSEQTNNVENKKPIRFFGKRPK